MMRPATPHWWQAPLQRDSLRYLTWYMSIQLAVMLVVLLAFSLQQITLPDRLPWLLLPSQALLTLTTLIAARRRQNVNTGLYLLLLAGSIGLLGWYLHDAGGHTNPVISLLLVPLAMGAALLGWQPTALIAVIVLLLYTALTQFFLPLEVTPLPPADHSGHAAHGGGHDQHFMQLHLIGMWITFAVSVLLIVGLVLPLAQSMRRQRDQIARQQEKMLLDEKLIAMATFAASAAHQLGTPLSTLAVLTDDLKEELRAQPHLLPDLDTMAQQIQVCKTTLRGMMRKADNLRQDVRETIAIPALTQRLRQQFNLLHPDRELRITTTPVPAVHVSGDETLDQALLNLLDNAARVSATDPELRVEIEDDTVCLRITDTGPGIPDAIRQQLGEPFVTSREDGLGLGLFLSHATINRLGGTLRLLSSGKPDHRGTVTEVRLPIATETAT